MKRVLFAILLSPIVLLSGCSAENFLMQFENSDNILIVRGAVYDKSPEKTPLKGIKVVMSSYLKDDAKQETPAETDTMFTNSSGVFEFVWKKFSFMHVYVLEAQDIDGEENKGSYKKDKIEILIRMDSPSFDLSNHTYTVEGNFFYLESLAN